jgi:hypothetical protein
VRCAQLRERRALATKPRDHVRVRRELRMQHLDRDLVAGRQVLRAVDRTEAAGRDLLADAEAIGHDLADQRVEPLHDGVVVEVVAHRLERYGSGLPHTA